MVNFVQGALAQLPWHRQLALLDKPGTPIPAFPLRGGRSASEPPWAVHGFSGSRHGEWHVHLSRQADTPQRLRFAALLAVMPGVAVVFANGLRQSHDERPARAAADTENMAPVREQHIAAVLLKSDLVLDHVADEVNHKARDKAFTPEELRFHLKKLKQGLPEVRLLRAIKADGHNLADSTDGGSPLYSGDRPCFRLHRDHPGLGPVVSEPVQGRAFPGWQGVLIRRIDNPDGSFGGIAAASLALLEKMVPAGKIDIALGSGEGKVRVTARDNGGGIPEGTSCRASSTPISPPRKKAPASGSTCRASSQIFH